MKGGENLLTITDIHNNTEGLTGYKGLKRYRNVNGERTLSFIVLPTEQNAHSFHMVQEESIVEFDGDTYRIKQMTEKPRGKIIFKEVIAIRTLFDLIDEFQYETHTGSMTFDAALNFVLGGTGYTWDIIGTFYAQSFENLGDDNRLALFQVVIKRYGVEFTLNGTHFTFREKIGNKTDFQFRYNYNIKTINRQVNTNNLSTYIKGYGKDIESEYTSPNAAIFGIRHAKPVRDERYTTLAGLNERLVSDLKDIPDVSITIDFVDMRRAGYPYDVPNEGDDVFLIYEPLNDLDLEARIMDIDEEFTENNPYPIKTNVTLANYRQKMTDRLAEFSRTSKTVNEIMEGSKKVPFAALDAAVQRATEAMQSAETELEFENGIIARSKTNPNHLVLFNSAGVAVSVDGGQTFDTAMTAEGFVADLITIGTMLADRIKGGTLTLGGLDNGNGIFRVLNEADEVVAELDAERGGFESLQIGDVISDSVVKRNDVNVTYYVDPVNGNDENDGLTTGTAFETPQKAIDSIPQYTSGSVTVSVVGTNKTMYGNISIQGFLGNGTIVIDFGSKTNKLNGRISIMSNTQFVRVRNGTVNYSGSLLQCVFVGRTTFTRFDNMAIYGNNVVSNGFSIDTAGNALILECEIYDVENCVDASYNSMAELYVCKGLGSNAGIRARNNSIVAKTGTVPGGLVSDESTTVGGQINGVASVDTGGATPPTPPPPPETTQEWSQTATDSWHEGYNVWDNTTDDPLQGKYGSAGRYRGCWFFGTAPSNAVTGKTIKRIRVYLKRANNSGSSASQTAVIRPHTYTSKPAGAPAYLGASHSVGFKWGEGKWVTLPSSFHSHFQSGNAKGIMIYTTNDSQYMRFSKSAKLEITYA